MLFFNRRERYCNNHPPLRWQLQVIFDLMFRVTESNGTKDALEDILMLRDEPFPHTSRKIAVWFVVQEIDKPKKIPGVFFYRSAANAPKKTSELEFLVKFQLMRQPERT